MTVQLFVFLWFRTAFCGLKGATGEVFEPVYEVGITQGPSDGFGAAQCLGQRLVLTRRDERRNLSTSLRHSSLRFTEHFLLLMTGRVG